MSKKDLDQKDLHIKNIHCTKSFLECNGCRARQLELSGYRCRLINLLYKSESKLLQTSWYKPNKGVYTRSGTHHMENFRAYMYVNICIHFYIYIYIYVYIFINMHMYFDIHIYINRFIYLHVYIYINI